MATTIRHGKRPRRALVNAGVSLSPAQLRPVVDRVMGLEDARGCHDILEQGHAFGKVVLRVGE